MEIVTNANKFNYLTHNIFPARTFLKDIIYWVTEIAAATILFAYIIEIKTVKMTLYNGYENKIEGLMYEQGDREMLGMGPVKRNGLLGISYLNANAAFAINDHPTDLLNREYAWICLCYMIKHAAYIADFFILFKRKLCKPWDFVTPVMNLWLWTMWGIYGWLKSDEQIHGGMYLRFRKDVIMGRDKSSPENFESVMAEYNHLSEVYTESMSWPWLWIICVIVAVSHLVLWLKAMKDKRSSAFTGLSLSVVAIPLQLLFLNLFFKGSWISSNWNTLFIDTTSPMKAMYSMQADYFEARWVFWIIYLSSWIAVGVFCKMCFFHALAMKKQGKPIVVMVKYMFYAVFWTDTFIWVLFMDDTLYHYYVNWPIGLIVTHAIALVCALVIATMSILEKKQEGDKFYTRHENWATWWCSSNEEGNDKALKDAFAEKGSSETAHLVPAHDQSQKMAEMQAKPHDHAQNADNQGTPAPAMNQEIHGDAHPYTK